MALSDGTYKLGPGSGKLLIKTGRSGLGKKAGHDLTLEVTRWEATATVDSAEPAQSEVIVTAEVDSIEVREGAGGVKPLTDSDRAEIKETFREKILHSAEHPDISFRSTGFSGTPESFTVEGELTIMGRTEPLTIGCEASGENRVHGTATVTQTRWGIKPYSAFFGALKLADNVQVEFDLKIA